MFLSEAYLSDHILLLFCRVSLSTELIMVLISIICTHVLFAGVFMCSGLRVYDYIYLAECV